MGCGEGNLELGTTLEWVSTGVGWVGKKRYDCSRMSSEWNGVYKGSLER